MALAQTTTTIAGPVKFGFSQLFKPTPEFAKLAFRFVLYLMAVVVAVLNIFSEIPPDLKGKISAWALEIVTFTHFLSKLFGIQVEEPTTDYR